MQNIISSDVNGLLNHLNGCTANLNKRFSEDCPKESKQTNFCIADS